MKLFLCSTSSHHHTTKNTTPISPPHVHQNISDENIDSVESIIRKWCFSAYSDRFSTLFTGDRKEAKLFLEGVTKLQEAMLYYLRLSSSSEKLVTAKNLMSIAMKRLEKEFYVILSSNQACIDSESSVGSHSSNSARSSVEDCEISEEESPDMATEDLKRIAECMIASGHGKECIDTYKLVRKSAINEALLNLGVETLSVSKMQKMEWKVLESKIKRWLRAVRVAVKTVFHGERTLCDAVFSSSSSESCFAEICRDSAADLFSFAENFGRSKRILSPEKIFRALDMYEAVSELLPEIESIFPHKSLLNVRTEAEAALVKLGEAVRVMLTEFEASMKKDASKPPAGGGVHPLARYVMNFLAFLADYTGAMSDIIVARTPLPESYFPSPTDGENPEVAASFTDRVAWLILVLLCKLDGKTAQCNDVALSYLFLANNLNYVVSKVRNSSLGILIGVDWISKHGSKVNQYLTTYEQMGWSDVISSLPNPTAEICHERVKECFGQFNTDFHEAFKRQASWVIPDPRLREEVKSSVADKLVSGYRALYDKYKGEVDDDDDTTVKYAPEDLNNYLSDLFADADGLGGSISSSYSCRSTISSLHDR